MLQTSRGSNDEQGRFVKTYRRGKTYDMETGWQQSVAHAFISTGRANEVQVNDHVVGMETKDTAPEQTDHGSPKIKPSAQWFRLRAYAQKLDGGKRPEDKPTALAILRQHGVLDEG
jgi:hypothetical protein